MEEKEKLAMQIIPWFRFVNLPSLINSYSLRQNLVNFVLYIYVEEDNQLGEFNYMGIHKWINNVEKAGRNFPRVHGNFRSWMFIWTEHVSFDIPGY